MGFIVKNLQNVNIKKMILNLFMTTASKEKEPQNCWEFMKCPKETREKCIVYETDSGNECWFLTDVKERCPASKEFDNCFDCQWFKKNNPDL